VSVVVHIANAKSSDFGDNRVDVALLEIELPRIQIIPGVSAQERKKYRCVLLSRQLTQGRGTLVPAPLSDKSRPFLGDVSANLELSWNRNIRRHSRN